MHDFAQAGPICTLHRLNDAYLPQLEAELVEHARSRPISVILPCHGADLHKPALRHILQELSSARWLRELFLSLNGVDAGGAAHARTLCQVLPYPARVLWNDEPSRALEIAGQLGAEPLEVPHGKGLNIWSAVQLIGAEDQSTHIALQDCDVTSFQRIDLARLVAACVDPRLDFHFAKMYYARVTDRLYGRVTRLFFTPLLAALRRVWGPTSRAEFLSAFRFALAGEVCLTTELAGQMAFHPGWGLEAKMLLEVEQLTTQGKVCQVAGSTGYQHRHHPAGQLEEICREIAETLLDPGGATPPLVHAYLEEAQRHVQYARAVAVMNGLRVADEETDLVLGFAEMLGKLPTPFPAANGVRKSAGFWSACGLPPLWKARVARGR